MTVRNVSTAAGLASALAASVGGDTILLAPGLYGVVSIVGRNFVSYVTLRSTDPLDRAILNSLTVDNSAFVRFDEIRVNNPTNGAAGGAIVRIQNSNHVEVLRSEISGKVDSIYEGNSGFYVKDSSVVTLSYLNIHDVHNGIQVFGGSSHTITENLIDYISTDCMKFGGVSNVLIENNNGGGHLYPSATAHADFMQFQGSASDVIIRGNVFLAQTSERAQGIFLNVPPYSNILIEQNIIYSGKINAIKVKDGTGITAQFNTCLLTPNLGHTAAVVNVPAGSSNHHNISASYKGAINGTNIAAQWDDVTDILHYDTLFKNAMAGLGVTLEDLRPVPGSLAETTGAFTRTLELLGGAPAPTPDPTPPPPDPDPAPIPTPTPEPGMIYQSGPHTFTGNVAEAVIVPHDPAYELATGSLEVKFTAGALSTRKGIFSKDATGNGTGGHIGVLAEQSKLVVRLQNGTGTFNADVLGAIAIGVQRHFVLTWGPGGMKVWLDGLLASSNAYTGGTIGNTEPIVIGANQWTSAAGTSVPIIDPFSGTIANVAIYDYALTEAEIGVLAGIIVPQTPEELIAALQAMIADLEATIAAQDATIATLSADLSAANIQVATLSAKIAAAQSALA